MRKRRNRAWLEWVSTVCTPLVQWEARGAHSVAQNGAGEKVLRLEPAEGGALDVDLNDLLVAIDFIPLAKRLPAGRHDLNENASLGDRGRARYAALVGLEVEFDA